MDRGEKNKNKNYPNESKSKVNTHYEYDSHTLLTTCDAEGHKKDASLATSPKLPTNFPVPDAKISGVLLYKVKYLMKAVRHLLLLVAHHLGDPTKSFQPPGGGRP